MQITTAAPPAHAFDDTEWQDLTEPMSSVLHWQSEVWNQAPPSLASVPEDASSFGTVRSRAPSAAAVGAEIARPPSTLMRAANKVRSAARLVVPDCIADGLSMAEVIRQITNG